MAGATASYKRILQLLEKWPVEEGKVGRDLGEFLRTKITKAYKENKFEANQKYWDSQYISLQRLVNNDYNNKYPRLLSSSATGLTAEQCKLALSNEFLKELQEEDRPFYKKIFSFKSRDK
ncbi:ubiquinol-cytochrome c reductase complex assembly factor 2 [Tribolium castaneum]|uniref:ubiquinol-cytochrome c reductase complex assembly factor 2 n=1 Tax=Tribolium castaneum TaxID=7070 RepID=UPI0030FE7A90